MTVTFYTRTFVERKTDSMPSDRACILAVALMKAAKEAGVAAPVNMAASAVKETDGYFARLLSRANLLMRFMQQRPCDLDPEDLRDWLTMLDATHRAAAEYRITMKPSAIGVLELLVRTNRDRCRSAIRVGACRWFAEKSERRYDLVLDDEFRSAVAECRRAWESALAAAIDPFAPSFFVWEANARASHAALRVEILRDIVRQK